MGFTKCAKILLFLIKLTLIYSILKTNSIKWDYLSVLLAKNTEVCEAYVICLFLHFTSISGIPFCLNEYCPISKFDVFLLYLSTSPVSEYLYHFSKTNLQKLELEDLNLVFVSVAVNLICLLHPNAIESHCVLLNSISFCSIELNKLYLKFWCQLSLNTKEN